MSERKLLILGFGYSAGASARLVAGEAAITGTVRSAEKAATLSTGVAALVFDGTRPESAVAAAIAAATDILVSVPPGGESDAAIARHRADIVAAPQLQWIGYLSSIGVYGNYGGAWVSERTTPHPPEGRATARLAAEKAWQKLAVERNVPLARLRIAGIYGPGRNAFVQLAGGGARRIVKPGQVFNRIHVADIAAVVAAAFRERAAGIFNLGDDEPSPGHEPIEYAARLMGVAPPPEVAFGDAGLSPMAKSFYDGNRRVVNRRIKEELGVALRYPTYRDGLDALWREGTWRG
ncbi:MAG: NAD(P)-dependent oxidoreductase [Rhizobiales bacterium]|nr:NAD(P)-dependent oxidoreductase [Hyphomicrobiales bacterium]